MTKTSCSMWAVLALILIWSASSISVDQAVIDQESLTSSLSEEAQRELVTVHLYINDLGYDSSGWTSNGIRKCGSSGYTSDSSSSTAALQFTYNIETNSSNPGSVEETIDRRLKNLIVNSVADGMCSSRRNLRVLSSERQLSLEKVDGSTADQSTGTCQPAVPASRSCHSYTGSLNVAFSQGSTKAKIRQRVLKTVKHDMDDGFYKKRLNQGLQGTGVSVTNIAFTSTIPTLAPPPTRPVYVPAPPVYTAPAPVSMPVKRPVYEITPATSAPSPKVHAASSQSNTYSSGGSGLAATGKILVAIAALLLLLILLACCWARYVVIMRRKRRLGATDETTPQKVMRSKDDASTAGHVSEDGESYRTTDMNDLGRYHSKLDVHKCTSATCRACNPHLSSPTSKAPTLAQIAEGMTTAPSSPDDEISVNEAPPPPPPPRRGRTRTARPRVQHPITFLKVTSPVRKSSQRDDEI